MASQPASIECSKCGARGPHAGEQCAKCGARLVKVCPGCRFKSSLAKRFCDGCGEPLGAYEAAEPAPAKPPTAPVEAVASGPVPAGRTTKPKIEKLTRYPTTKKTKPFRGGPWAPSFRPLLNPYLPTVAATLIFSATLATYYVHWRPRISPANLSARAAARYLEDLRSGDYLSAYEMLSSLSRTYCTQAEFKKIRDAIASRWDYSDVQPVVVESNAAFIRYQLKVDGQPAETDYLSLVRENGRWVRPYVWNLLDKVEDAFDKGDPQTALGLARSAVIVDPREPMAHAYLCEAQYYSMAYPEAEKTCETAIRLADRYPSRLNTASRYHLHAILGDAYKNHLDKPQAALDHYNKLLTFPKLGAGDRCDILLARADTYGSLRLFTTALSDIKEADRHCVNPQDREYLSRQLRVLSGQAQNEAVALARRHRMTNGGPTLDEWRDQMRKRVAKRYPRTRFPPDRWAAEPVTPPRYRVVLMNGDSVVLSAEVDLWTNIVNGVKIGEGNED